jgi:hypothetical protein
MDVMYGREAVRLWRMHKRGEEDKAPRFSFVSSFPGASRKARCLSTNNPEDYGTVTELVVITLLAES